VSKEKNPWVHTELIPHTTGEKIANATKIFLMGYGAYRLLGDILGLGKKIFRRTRRTPVHGD
jgi:hypothetical protein